MPYKPTSKPPLPLGHMDSNLIHQCQPHSPPKWQLGRFMHFRTTTQQSPHWLQWNAPHLTPKLPLPHSTISKSHLIHHSLNLSHSPPQTASRSNQPFFHNSSTEQTDQLTDWQMGEATRLLQHPLMLYSLYRNVANNTACYNLINHRMGKF